MMFKDHFGWQTPLPFATGSKTFTLTTPQPLLPFRPCPGHWNWLAPHSGLQFWNRKVANAIMPSNPSCAPIMFTLWKAYLSVELLNTYWATKKNRPHFPLYGLFHNLIEILTLVYYNPHITGQFFIAPKIPLTTRDFGEGLLHLHLHPAWIFVASKLTRRSPAEKSAGIDHDWSHYGVGRKWWEKYRYIMRIK